MSLTLLAAAALATARLAQLLIFDDFGPLTDLRRLIHSRWPSDDTRFYASAVTGSDDLGWTTDRGIPVFRETEHGIDTWYAIEPHPFGVLWACVRCMSVWSGLAVTAFIFLAPSWVMWPVLLPFALSQAAIILTRGE